MDVPEVHSLEELVGELHKVFDSDCVNIEHVKVLLDSYKSNPKEWKKYAKFDVHRYTRNLIDVGNGKFNLMALCWGESQGSSIHDHSDSHCFVKVLDGSLKETMYDWPQPSEQQETAMVKRQENIYIKDKGVAYINDSMGLHRMENPSHSDPAVTMHLYSPPFSACHTFDERTSHCREAQVTFWSQFGQRTPFATTCAVASAGTDVSRACCNEDN